LLELRTHRLGAYNVRVALKNKHNLAFNLTGRDRCTRAINKTAGGAISSTRARATGWPFSSAKPENNAKRAQIAKSARAINHHSKKHNFSIPWPPGCWRGAWGASVAAAASRSDWLRDNYCSIFTASHTPWRVHCVTGPQRRICCSTRCP
jgi:hypothetical protein